jgi:hypothetical protein
MLDPFEPYPWQVCKWMQPPVHVPDWMCTWMFSIIDIIGTPEDNLCCGILDDLANAEGTPLRYPHSEHPGEAAYQLWKCAMDVMWMSNVPLNAYQGFIEESAAARNCNRSMPLPS